MKKIIRLIAGIANIALIMLLSQNAAAQRRVPAAHNQAMTATEVSQSFVEQSYENARLHSPFKACEAVEAAPAADFSSPLTTRMTEYASRYLGTRYRLGATGPSAFDCSGFTSYVFRNFGIELNRTSREQYTQGSRVNIKDLRPGDLLFFSSRSSGRNVGHVAMVASVDRKTNTCKFIHASVKHGVTYQNFPDGGYYSNHFIGAKRVITDRHIQANL